ncbi:kinase-like protein [Panus rudis PR-1116 ss-1]|nr:kinase-like protein [Panus rudis PR-1116 ss-1]
MKVGIERDSEILAMQLVREQTNIPVPAVRRVFGNEGYRTIVMDYISGKTLDDCWPDLGLWQRVRIIWTIRRYIRQLRHVLPKKAASRPLFPGPVASEPQICHGTMFTDYGAGPFASYEELKAWFVHKLDVNRRIRKHPPESRRVEFDSSMPLVLTHLDLHTTNIIIGDDGRVWLIDWEYAGFYPQWFEYASMRDGWDILGRWKLWILGFMAGFYERQLHFIFSIGWALNTGVFL